MYVSQPPLSIEYTSYTSLENVFANTLSVTAIRVAFSAVYILTDSFVFLIKLLLSDTYTYQRLLQLLY